MKKKNKIIKNIAGIFALMLLLSILVMMMSVSAQGLGIPIKLGVTVEPSTIEVGENAIITIRLLDENDKPVVTEVDVPVDISTDLGYVPPSVVIPAGKDSLSTSFTSKDSGIAAISVKSRGFMSGTTAIVVIPAPTYVKLGTIKNVGVGEPLAVSGTTNREEGHSMLITAKGPTELTPAIAPVKADGKFNATIDTSTAKEGTYLVKVDDGDGHTDEASVTIGAAKPSPLPTPTPMPEPTFEAVFAIADLLAVAYLLRKRR